jgi:hypothetical protein
MREAATTAEGEADCISEWPAGEGLMEIGERIVL